MRPIAQAPDWVLRYLDKTQPSKVKQGQYCCSGFIRLSCNAVLVFCNNRRHVTADKYRGATRVHTGFILKRFSWPGHSPVINYRMKISRALKVRRPLVVDFTNYSELHRMGAVTWFSRERDYFKAAPLTDDEWMLATAVMYFLEKWP